MSTIKRTGAIAIVALLSSITYASAGGGNQTGGVGPSGGEEKAAAPSKAAVPGASKTRMERATPAESGAALPSGRPGGAAASPSTGGAGK